MSTASPAETRRSGCPVVWVAPLASSFERFEVKYWVPEPLAQKLARRARSLSGSTAAGSVAVTSLYLDTPRLDFLRLHSDEAHVRVKLRVRAYGGAPATVGLEIKRRYKAVVNKRRAMVSSSELPDLLALRRVPPLHSDQDRANLEAFLYLKAVHRAQPVLLVRCLREAYSPDEADGRMTIDRHIVCQPARGADLTGAAGAWRPVLPPAGRPEGAVVELKFRGAAPPWIQDLAADLGPWRTAFSKYARGMTQRRDGRRETPLQAVIPRNHR